MADYQIEGLKEFKRALAKLGDVAVQDGKDMNAEAAQIVERRAEQVVPRRTGRLQQSIRSTGTKRDGIVRAGRASVPYAGPIHYGWADRPGGKWAPGKGPQGGPIGARSFLTDALEEKERDVFESYERAIAILVRKYG